MASSPADAQAPAGWDAHVHVFDANTPVRPGHYVPETRTLADIEAIASQHGVGHLVLVQPSVYGSDNSLMLQALQGRPGRHRGVVVLDAQADDAQLDAMHALGVRGARFNLVSPVGNDERAIEPLAPKLAARGWHAQWYAPARELPRLARLQHAMGLVFVLDHLAGLSAGSTDAEWHALAQLARAGAWIKLSGWYRLRGLREPYLDVVALLVRVRELFGERMVWGSDWPHTSLSAAPRYDALIEPVRVAFGDAFTEAVLRSFAARLYAHPIAISSSKDTTC